MDPQLCATFVRDDGKHPSSIPWLDMQKTPEDHGSVIRSVVMVRPEAGGVAYMAASCAQEMRARGINVTELVGSEGGSPAYDGFRMVWAHRAQIRAADVVHVELGITAISAFWLAVWTSVLRGRLVTVVHDGPRIVNAPGSGLIRTGHGRRDAFAHKVFAPLLDRPLRAWIVSRTQEWVTPSHRSAAEMEAAELSPTTVVPLGAGPPLQSASPSQCDTIIYAGFISPDKGLDILIDAWELIHEETTMRLRIIGGYSRQHANYADRLRDRLADCDRTSSWSGWVNDEDFSLAVAEAAIVVLPYRQSNPVSGVLIRAAVEGRAIVGSDVPAITDFLLDGVSAEVLKRNTADQLARTLLTLCSNPRVQDELGAEAARWAKEHCSWQGQVDQLLSVYRMCVRI